MTDVPAAKSAPDNAPGAPEQPSAPKLPTLMYPSPSPTALQSEGAASGRADELPARAEKPLDAGAGFLPDAPAAYSELTHDAFEQVRRVAYEQSPEDHRAVLEARDRSGEVMHEFGVFKDEARGLSAQLSSNWNAPEISDDDYGAQAERMHALLQREWGRDYGTNMQAAEMAEDAAAAKLPWLTPLLNRRPNIDAVRQLARIGLRMQTKAKI